MRPIISDEEFAARVKSMQCIMEEQGIDILLAYGNEAEPQFQRYFSNYWPSFESAGGHYGTDRKPHTAYRAGKYDVCD